MVFILADADVFLYKRSLAVVTTVSAFDKPHNDSLALSLGHYISVAFIHETLVQ